MLLKWNRKKGRSKEMRKMVLLGCLCLAGLFAATSCGDKKTTPKKEDPGSGGGTPGQGGGGPGPGPGPGPGKGDGGSKNTPSELRTLCKAFAKMEALANCDEEMTEAELQTAINSEVARCNDEKFVADFAAEDLSELSCKRLNAAGWEELADELEEDSVCGESAVNQEIASFAESEEWCLDSATDPDPEPDPD
jgi:hypothetical protein